MKIGFIGAGEMGGAIIRGLLSKGYPKEDILAGVHTEQSAARLQAELGITAGTDNVRVIREANWLFLAQPRKSPNLSFDRRASGPEFQQSLQKNCPSLARIIEEGARFIG